MLTESSEFRVEHVAGRPAGAFMARPGYVERLLAWLSIFMLTVGLPTEWLEIVSGAEVALASGGPLVIIVFGGLSASLFLFLTGHGDTIWRMVSAEPLMPIFLGIITLSTLWSADPAITIRRAVSLILATMIGYYFAARYDLGDLIRLVGSVFTVALALHITWAVALPQYGTMTTGQWSGLLHNKNPFGEQMALFTILFVLAGIVRRRLRFSFFGLAVASFGALVMSQSKTSLVAVILSLVLLMVFFTFRSRKTLYGAVLLSELIASALGLLIATASLPVIADLLGKDITLSGRTVLWEMVIDEIAEAPWLGHGWDAYWGGFFSPSHDIWIAHRWLPPSAHNAILEYLLDIGIVGTVAFVLLILRIAVRGTRHLRRVGGAQGVFPLSIVSLAVLFSVTEAGVAERGISWTLLVTSSAVIGITGRRIPAKTE